jgi:lysophospholipase L1-like esterase
MQKLLFVILTLTLTLYGDSKNITAIEKVNTSLVNNVTKEIGAREVKSTPITKNTLFASTKGIGQSCSKKEPCSLETALKQVKPGEILFLRGGVYPLKKSLKISTSATKDKPIMIESYPDEHAILDGGEDKKSISMGVNIVRDGILLQGAKYIEIRNLEIRHMSARGINILYSSHILIEGCHIHHNYLSGITIYGGHYNKPYKPYKYGYNILKDNIIHHNSDAGLNTMQKDNGHTYSYEDGDNADGISISSGKFNRVIHNTVFANADDGIDFWRSNNSYAGYNLVYDNGRGRGGNGNGIKAGGNRHFDNKADAPNGKNALIEHNIAFLNKRTGFDINSGKKVTYRYNTAWKNGKYGFSSYDDTIVTANIAANNSYKTILKKQHKNNSWQYKDKVLFQSIDPKSPNFLKPQKGSTFEKIGAYAKEKEIEKKSIFKNIYIIGDSTVHNNSFGEMGWGSQLSSYMHKPKKLFNLARSGASSHTFMQNDSRHQHDWEHVKELLKKEKNRDNAYLFIQFGHNNKDKDYQAYYHDLKTYVETARNLGVIPVLITPVERLYKNVKSHDALPYVVRQLADTQKVLLLDLQKKSWLEFKKFKNHKAIQKSFAYDDITHFSPKGASIVASWIKTLACQADNELCKQFK